MPTSQGRSRRRVRSLFVSDLHLGCQHSRAEAFLDFLAGQQPEQLYLAGDIIDGWRLRRKWRWTPAFSAVLARLLDLADEGTQLYYAAGNHDEFLRHFLRDFRIVEVADEFVHEAIDGRRFLVLHGDRFDNVEIRAPWLSLIGSVSYDALMALQAGVNAARQLARREPVQLCGWVKRRVKGAIAFVSNFRERLAQHAQARGCDGVICGHVHTPVRAQIGPIAYFNTGDWVENCTAVAEYSDGSWELQHLPWSPKLASPVELRQPALPLRVEPLPQDLLACEEQEPDWEAAATAAAAA